MKTFIFLFVLSAIFMSLGYLIAGSNGIFIGFFLAAVVNFTAYWFSDKIILTMHHAQSVHPGDSFGLHEMVERLAQRAGLPTPQIYLIPDHSPNAFATGRNPHHSAIAVTQGLLGALSYQELESVLAHELAHIKNRDTLVGCIAATMAAAILVVARTSPWGIFFGTPTSSARTEGRKSNSAFRVVVMAIVSPLAATLIQFAVSRSREYMADLMGAELCGSPERLANALQKIHSMSSGLPLASGNPATAHLYIVNPFSGTALLNLFSTHPSVEDRIAKLLKLG
ncbi:MAG: zinc metalloprotease HtpX [Bdellovibrionota bacterium]